MNAGEDNIIFEFRNNYSGLIEVKMVTDYYRNLTSTWIKVVWEYTPMIYNEIRHLEGTMDTEYFPVVGSSGEIISGGVCYIQLGNDRNETVAGSMTVTYIY
jgi:hypothetical protein